MIALPTWREANPELVRAMLATPKTCNNCGCSCPGTVNRRPDGSCGHRFDHRTLCTLSTRVQAEKAVAR
jgi:hypothetical protein